MKQAILKVVVAVLLGMVMLTVPVRAQPAPLGGFTPNPQITISFLRNRYSTGTIGRAKISITGPRNGLFPISVVNNTTGAEQMFNPPLVLRIGGIPGGNERIVDIAMPENIGEVSYTASFSIDGVPDSDTATVQIEQNAENGQFTYRIGGSSISFGASTLDPNTPANQPQTPKSVCAGEEMLLTIVFTDKDYYRPTPTSQWEPINGTGPYQVVLSISGDAAFDSPNGAVTKTENGSRADSIKVFVKSNAFSAGRPSSFTVTATLKDNATPPPPQHTGSAKDDDYPFTWTFVNRTSASPTSMEQISPSAPFSQWRPSFPNAPEYIYQMKPDDPAVAEYEDQTVQEQFDENGITAYGFTADSLTDVWKANSGIDFDNDPDALNKAARLLFSSGTNGSFVITTFLGPDQIKDAHQGVGGDGTWATAIKTDVYYPTFPNGSPNPLYLPSGFGFVLPQTYLCCGNPIGNYTLTRVVQTGANAGQVLINKSGP